jgi:hypothetical protein
MDNNVIKTVHVQHSISLSDMLLYDRIEEVMLGTSSKFCLYNLNLFHPDEKFTKCGSN